MTFVVNTTPAPLAAVFGVNLKLPGLPESTRGILPPSVYPWISITHAGFDGAGGGDGGGGCGGGVPFFLKPTQDCPGYAPQKSCLGVAAVFPPSQHSPALTVPLTLLECAHGCQHTRGSLLPNREGALVVTPWTPGTEGGRGTPSGSSS